METPHARKNEKIEREGEKSPLPGRTQTHDLPKARRVLYCYATTTAHGTFGAVGRCLLLINVCNSYYFIYFTLNWTPAPTSLL